MIFNDIDVIAVVTRGTRPLARGCAIISTRFGCPYQVEVTLEAVSHAGETAGTTGICRDLAGRDIGIARLRDVEPVIELVLSTANPSPSASLSRDAGNCPRQYSNGAPDGMLDL